MYNTSGDLCGEVRKVINGTAEYLLFNSNRVVQYGDFTELSKKDKMVIRMR